MTFNEVLDEPASGEGGSGGGENGEGNWPVINPDDPTEYEARFYTAANDYDDFTARVNTPLDIPAAPEGMMWPVNMPSVMPPCNFRAYAMPEDSDITTLYKLEYKMGEQTREGGEFAPGEILRTDYLPAGSIVFLYPAPEGKTWKHVPTNQKMPAHDLTLTAE